MITIGTRVTALTPIGRVCSITDGLPFPGHDGRYRIPVLGCGNVHIRDISSVDGNPVVLPLPDINALNRVTRLRVTAA